MFGKTSVKFVRAALDKYLPSVPAQRLRFGAPLNAEGVRVHVAPDHIVDYAQVGGWWQSSTGGGALLPTQARADSGLQTITAVVSAEIVGHFRPFLFPISADDAVVSPYDESDEFVIQKRTVESYEFLIQLANNAIQNSDKAYELARALVSPLRDAIDRHNLERDWLARPDVSDNDDPPTIHHPVQVTGSARRVEVEVGVRELHAALKDSLPRMGSEIVDFPEGSGGTALRIVAGDDHLVFFRNATGGWGDLDDQNVTSVNGEHLEDITLGRLVIYVTWRYLNEQVTAGSRSKNRSFALADDTGDAINFLRRRSRDSGDESERDLAVDYLSHLEVWSRDDLKRSLGFSGPSRSVFEAAHKVADAIQVNLPVDRVIPRLDDDDGYTVFVVYKPESGSFYRLGADGEWSENGEAGPLKTWLGNAITAPTVQQVVAYVASDLATLGYLEDWSDPGDTHGDGEEAPINLGELLSACLAFLDAIAGGRVDGYESAQEMAVEYVDHAPRRTASSALDDEAIEYPDLEFPEFGPEGWQSPKSP